MKNQALFSSKDKSKKLKCPLLQFMFGALRVKIRGLSDDDSGIIFSCFSGGDGWCDGSG